VNGETNYDVDGPPDGSPIVFVHGTRLSRAVWRSQMNDLRDTYRVVAFDLPGHGALAAEPFTIAAAADELAHTIETVGGGHAVVVGLSLGGYVAMDLAARRPDLVRGLVLSGATAEPVGRLAAPYLALAWFMDRFDGPGLHALKCLVLPEPLRAGHRRPDRRGRILVRRRGGGAAGPRR